MNNHEEPIKGTWSFIWLCLYNKYYERLIYLPYHLGVDTETLLLKIEVLILMDMKTKMGS